MFTARRQTIHSYNGSFQDRLEFVCNLYYYHRKINRNFSVIPVIHKKSIDIYHLYKSVGIRGGFDNVCKEKLWAQVCRELGIYSLSSHPTTLKNLYKNLLSPFDKFINSEEADSIPGPGVTVNDVKFSPYISMLGLLPGENLLNSRIPKENITLDFHINNDNGKTELTDSISSYEENVKTTLKNGSHGSQNTTASDNQIHTPNLKKSGLVTDPEDTILSGDSYIVSRLQNRNKDSLTLYNTANNESLHDLYTVTCSSTLLKRLSDDILYSSLPRRRTIIQNDDWHHGQFDQISDINLCISSGKYTIPQFLRKADAVFNLQFGDAKTTTEDIENAYWKLFKNKNKSIEVEYGFDVPSVSQGSAFPEPELSESSIHPWNFNILPKAEGSLFNNVSENISYFTGSNLNVGMVFTTKSWHFSDYFTNTISYHHTGDPQIRYSIPDSQFEKFQDFIKKKLGPSTVDFHPELVLEGDIMVDLDTLISSGFDVYTTCHQPGEIIITTPKSYCSSINTGFNVIETVRFLSTNTFMENYKETLEYYNQHKLPHPFSFERLVYNVVKTRSDYPEIFNELRRKMVKQEISLRKLIRSQLKLVEEHNPKDETKMCCMTCKPCFFSYVEGDDGKNYSLEMFSKAPTKNGVIKLHIRDQELELLQSKSMDTLWLNNYHEIMLMKPRLSIVDLEMLLGSSNADVVKTTEYRSLSSFAKSFVEKIKEIHGFLQQISQEPVTTWKQFEDYISYAYTCPVDSETLDLLKSFAIKVVTFIEKAKSLVNGPFQSAEVYNSYLEEGKSFHIELPILNNIAFKYEVVSLTTFEKRFYGSLTAQGVNQVVKIGKSLGILEDDDCMKNLVVLKNLNTKLRDSIKDLLNNQKYYDISEMSCLVSQIETSGLICPEYEEFLKTYDHSVKFQTSIDQYIADSSSDNYDDLPDVDQIIEFIDKITKESVHINFSMLTKLVEEVQQWRSTMKSVIILVPNTDLKSQLEKVLNRTRSLLDPLFDSKTYTCLCGSTDGSEFKLECEKCKKKFHRNCMEPFDVEVVDGVFLCPICDLSLQQADKRIKFENFSEWMAEGSKLPLQCAEFLLMKELHLQYSEFIDYINANLESNKESLEWLRIQATRYYGFYLRLPSHLLESIFTSIKSLIDEIPPIKKDLELIQQNSKIDVINGQIYDDFEDENVESKHLRDVSPTF